MVGTDRLNVPSLDHFQPVVQRFLHVAFVSPSWFGCSAILCISVICWSGNTVVCDLCLETCCRSIHG